MSKRPEPYSPYCGLVVNDNEQYEKVQGAPHLAISAPTRTGKTRRLLAPAAVLHPGPLVAVSSKEDLAELVLMRRGVTGPTGVIDLRPEKTLVWPQGVRSMVSDPTASIGSADEALTVAETMLATSGVGFGGASSGQAVAAGGLWESTASRPLACLLYAASPQGNSQGMPWVLEAVENLGVDDEDGPGGQMSLDATPSWMTAAALCPHPMLSDPMQRVLTMNSRMRDSVAITVSKAVTPWVRLGLSATEHLDRLSAVDELSIESFDVSMLDEPDASLFVIAPNTGTVAGAAVALIDSIIRHFRKRTAQHQLEHRLLLELDEVCNSCPLPALLNYVGESAGLGVNIMATVQASSHFDVVYGPKYADALRASSPAPSLCTARMNAFCSNRRRTGRAWPHVAPSPMSPTAEAVRSHHNWARSSTGRNCFRRATRRLSCCSGAPPVAVFKYPTGARFSTSTTVRSTPAGVGSRRSQRRPEAVGRMVFVDADRVVAVTDARNLVDSMLAGARLGRMTHIVQGREVVAHLVPPAARIIDQDALLAAMATALLRHEAQIIGQRTSRAAGTDTGRLFAWAWRTDARLFTRFLEEFTELLSTTIGRPYSTADAFDLLRSALRDAGLG
ncbi:type IV secretory system conjugative DNA transfer family protein, partial [Mycolicibacterium septicum]